MSRPRTSNGQFAPGPTKPILERFLEKIEIKDNGCWEWTAAKNHNGYGYFGIGSMVDNTKRTILAHDFSYIYFIGTIPRGLEPDHLCRNPSCVNPYHLELVTHRRNCARGIAPFINSILNRKTACHRGHPYNDVYIDKHGHRSCNECRRENERARYWANPEKYRRLALEKQRSRKQKGEVM